MDTEQFEVSVDRVAAGGDAIGRDGDGRVAFVAGAIPGERVVARVLERRGDFSRSVAVDVLDASPDRVVPPCHNLHAGCGGCPWQHVALERQRDLKIEMVRDALRRIARLPDGDQPRIGVAVPANDVDGFGMRTTARLAVVDGEARYHQAGTADTAPAHGCLTAHPRLRDVIDSSRFGAASEVIIRVSVASGQRVVLLPGGPDGAPPSSDGVEVPGDVEVVAGKRKGARRGIVTEKVAGRRLEVSIDSFFQSGPAAATTLVETVDGLLTDDPPASVADLYGGVGLFGHAIAVTTGAVPVVVERSVSSVADAVHNLATIPGADVVRSDVGRWRSPHSFDLVVADPARPGLGKPGVDAVVRARPKQAVLVSCDVASFARDVRLLADAGYDLERSVVVDAFAHTPHVEVVSRFRRRR